MSNRMSLLVTDELPRPRRIVRPNGQVAYTVMRPEEIDALNWRYLSAFALATGRGNPVGFYVRWPGEFRPLSVI